MKTTITKIFNFESAHSLPNHDGKCNGVHGHSYKLEVSIAGAIITTGPKEGMVMDFADLKNIVNTEVLEKLDHKNLNDVLPFTTTAENTANWIFETLEQAGLQVSKIKLWETATSFVEVQK